MSLNLEQFVKNLTDLGLMSASSVRQFASTVGMGPGDGDAKSFARLLVQHGKLTQFQANAVYQGHGAALLIGEYLVQEKIGQGGMGAVYKAEHRMMKRVAALKLMSAALASTDVARQRFLREVQAAARLVHPNIVAAYDAGLHHGTPYMAMEFVSGVDLKTLVHKKGAVPWERAVDLVKQAAKGLLYAHESGVIHRDVKPANLLLSRESVLKILDMGLARLSHADGRSELDITQSGSLMGTAAFMAPEQARDAKRADHRSDIYALGCTMYYIIAGKLPYEGESAVDMMLVKMEKPPPRIDEAALNAPQPLQDVFEGMVAVDPADRYQSLKDVLADLEAIRQGDMTISRGPASRGLLAAEIDQMRGPVTAEPGQTIDTNATGMGELVRLKRRQNDVPIRTVARYGAIAAIVAAILISGLVLALRGKRQAKRVADTAPEPATTVVSPPVSPESPVSTPTAVPASLSPVSAVAVMAPAEPTKQRPSLTPIANRPQRPFLISGYETVVLEESFESDGESRLWRPTASGVTSMTILDGLAVAPADAATAQAIFMRQMSGLDIRSGPVHVYWRVYAPYVEGHAPNTVEVSAGNWSVRFQPHTQLRYFASGNRSDAYTAPVDSIESAEARQHLGDRSRAWFDLRLDVRMLPGGVGDYHVSVYVDSLGQWEPIATASKSTSAPAPGEAMHPTSTQLQLLTLRLDALAESAPAGIEAVTVTQDPPPQEMPFAGNSETTERPAPGTATRGPEGGRLRPPPGRRPLPPGVRPGTR